MVLVNSLFLTPLVETCVNFKEANLLAVLLLQRIRLPSHETLLRIQTGMPHNTEEEALEAGTETLTCVPPRRRYSSANCLLWKLFSDATSSAGGGALFINRNSALHETPLTFDRTLVSERWAINDALVPNVDAHTGQTLSSPIKLLITLVHRCLIREC